MQILQIRIHQQEPHHWQVEIENLSREDATKQEKAIVNILEKHFQEVIKGLMNPESIETWEIKVKDGE